jgi:PadR family transcriptional regulator PadR
MTGIDTAMLERELKKGEAELIVLSIVETGAKHGYEIGKLIETYSERQLKFHAASLYPLSNGSRLSSDLLQFPR